MPEDRRRGHSRQVGGVHDVVAILVFAPAVLIEAGGRERQVGRTDDAVAEARPRIRYIGAHDRAVRERGFPARLLVRVGVPVAIVVVVASIAE